MARDASSGILSGLRVVDLGHGIAAPVAAHLLAEAGAEVVKVEPPGGDPDRASLGFHAWNRGKRSVVLDTATPEGQADLDRLLAAADAVIHDLTPAVAATRGLDDATLRDRFPELIVSAIGGWPAHHEDAEFPVEESLVMARLGLFDEQPGHRDGPVFVRLPLASWLAAWLSAIGVVARLLDRDRGGAAGAAHTSLVQGALVPMSMHWQRAENPTPGFAKGLDKNVPIPIHRCSDGRYIHIHYSPDLAPYMRDALAAMSDEERAAENAKYPPSHVAPNFGANRKIIATRPSQEWLEHLWAHDVAVQPCAELGEIFFDEQARLNGYVVEVDDPDHGPLLQPGPAYRVTPTAGIRDGFRALGADTDDVLAAWEPKRVRLDVARRDRPPLAGVKVLDLGAYLAGPVGPMLLADLGADVIKLEAPSGDAMRYLERAFSAGARGKRAIALNLGDARARPVLEALVRWADVVHHNMRRPAARKLGVDYAGIAAINPDIVYCHVSSYGPDGPRADWPGYDQMFQSSCGWEVASGGEGNPPLWLRFGMCDHFASVASVYATILGLYHRDRTGAGQETAASLLGATILSVSETAARPDGTILPYSLLDHEQTGLAPDHRIFRCADGWIAVAARTDEARTAFRSVGGADPVAAFAARPADAVLTDLAVGGVPAAPVRENQMEAFLGDPANRVADLVQVSKHSYYGTVEQVGTFWYFGDRVIALERAAPTIGEQSREIIAELGFSEHFAEELLAAGVMNVDPAPWSGRPPARVTGAKPKSEG